MCAKSTGKVTLTAGENEAIWKQIVPPTGCSLRSPFRLNLGRTWDYVRASGKLLLEIYYNP